MQPVQPLQSSKIATIFDQIRKSITPPLEIEESKRIHSILQIISVICLIATAWIWISLLRTNELQWTAAIALALTDCGLIVSLWLTNRQKLEIPRRLVPLFVLLLVTFLNFRGNGIHDVTVFGHFLLIAIAGLLLGRNAPIIYAGLSTLALAGVVFAETNGIIHTPYTATTGYDDVLSVAVVLFMTGIFIRLTVSNLTDSLERVKQNEKDLVQKNAQLLESDEKIRKLVTDLQTTVKDLEVANQIAEENSRLKSEFLATMSHELRTPLNAIGGFTGIILNRIGGTECNDTTYRYCERIQANSQRLLALVNDLLDLSRVESGRYELANMPFSPVNLVEKWREQVVLLIESKGLAFELNVAPDLPSELVGDEEAISKIALNLLTNAVKFTEQGKISLTITQNADRWQIEVSDTGIGIPPHAREIIFEEFRQVDQSSRRKYGGTGLGLAIVQRLVRLMHGSVMVKSEVGIGSTFTVNPPLHSVAEKV
jgi:signal transduction histidine kinase